MDLAEVYRNLLLEIGFNSKEINDLWCALQKAYTSKSRHYHTLKHLEEMISLFDACQSQLKFPNEVLFSIFYHDFVYKATRKDNEIKSADHAVQLLPKTTSLDKNLVYEMIFATKFHLQNETKDINWLIDFDLKVLAKNWNEYQIYSQQIRKEYKIYPDFLYKPGRKKALLHFLEHDFIYQTDYFRINHETQARENIQIEIETL